MRMGKDRLAPHHCAITSASSSSEPGPGEDWIVAVGQHGVPSVDVHQVVQLVMRNQSGLETSGMKKSND